jgi:MULE transposase domain
MWYLSTVRLTHNHPPQLEPGAKPRSCPTQEQKQVVKRLATSNLNNFRRGHILGIVNAQNSAAGAVLEPRQLSNIMNEARREKRTEVEKSGGNFQAIVEHLTAKNLEEPGWVWFIKLDGQGTVTTIWWQSPCQALLHQKYSDIILNDNTYKRNMYGYALNIGIIIDGQGCSRNAWYCLMAFETTDYHGWVLESSLKASGKQPDVFMSDRDAALIAAVRNVFPLSFHIYCLHHLTGNLDTNLRSVVPWTEFLPQFWAAF